MDEVNHVRTDFVVQKLDSDLVLVRKDPYLQYKTSGRNGEQD
jgi:hypothetical protein